MFIPSSSLKEKYAELFKQTENAVIQWNSRYAYYGIHKKRAIIIFILSLK